MEDKAVIELLFDDNVDFVEEIPLRPKGPSVSTPFLKKNDNDVAHYNFNAH